MQLVPAVCGDQGEILAVGVPEMTWLLFQEWVLVNLDSTSEVEGFLSLMGILRRCFITFLNVYDPMCKCHASVFVPVSETPIIIELA